MLDLMRCNPFCIYMVGDVNDCVAVPRGIFKAYLWIMGGFGLLGISGALP